MKSKFKLYYSLTKPGVTYGNVLTAVAGFLLAAAGIFDWALFLAMLIGMTLVIGGACALNNYLDRDIDALMARTKKRPSVTGEISPTGMWVFATTITLIGLAILAVGTNWLTVLIGLLGFVTYVWLYGAWTKRTSIHGTAVGAVSGALPIVGGYTAVANTLDIGTLIVFLVIFFWQFPEFYSIAIYRRKEYAKANIPLMPVVKGVFSTKIQIIFYTFAFVISSLSLSVYSHASVTYFIVMMVLGLYWLGLSVRGIHTPDSDSWARGMFKFSLIVLLVFCALISIDAWLP